MPQAAIHLIQLPLPLRLGSVNCYLLESQVGFLLVDTGPKSQRSELLRHLSSFGCIPGKLQLILLTHGDFDHTGNAAVLHRQFQADIAMHPADRGMAEQGDMTLGRNSSSIVLKWISPLIMPFGKGERFTPDILLKDGFSLETYHLNARVLSIPGHSRGSIGVLTEDGCLFCGDLFDNTSRPALNTLLDDPSAARASLEGLRRLNIKTIYPGHGAPFSAGLVLGED